MDKIDELATSIRYVAKQEHRLIEEIKTYDPKASERFCFMVSDEVLNSKEKMVVFALERILCAERNRLEQFQRLLNTYTGAG